MSWWRSCLSGWWLRYVGKGPKGLLRTTHRRVERDESSLNVVLGCLKEGSVVGGAPGVSESEEQRKSIGGKLMDCPAGRTKDSKIVVGRDAMRRERDEITFVWVGCRSTRLISVRVESKVCYLRYQVSKNGYVSETKGVKPGKKR